MIAQVSLFTIFEISLSVKPSLLPITILALTFNPLRPPITVAVYDDGFIGFEAVEPYIYFPFCRIVSPFMLDIETRVDIIGRDNGIRNMTSCLFDVQMFSDE